MSSPKAGSNTSPNKRNLARIEILEKQKGSFLLFHLLQKQILDNLPALQMITNFPTITHYYTRQKQRATLKP